MIKGKVIDKELILSDAGQIYSFSNYDLKNSSALGRILKFGDAVMFNTQGDVAKDIYALGDEKTDIGTKVAKGISEGLMPIFGIFGIFIVFCAIAGVFALLEYLYDTVMKFLGF